MILGRQKGTRTITDYYSLLFSALASLRMEISGSSPMLWRTTTATHSPRYKISGVSKMARSTAEFSTGRF